MKSKVVLLIIVFGLLAANLAYGAPEFKLLFSFDDTNGYRPAGALVQGNNGNFYGTTMMGSRGFRGTVFAMTPDGDLYTMVEFGISNDIDEPLAGLTKGSDGNLYGTARFEGNSLPYGSIYKVKPSGKTTNIFSFNDTNGIGPGGLLLLGKDGDFYGTTINGGGMDGFGAIFRMSPKGDLTNIFSFNGEDGYGGYLFNVTDYGNAGLVEDQAGYIYGTSEMGGQNYGTVYKIGLDGTLIWAVPFHGTNGWGSFGGLIQCQDGNFYGATVYGGTNFPGPTEGTIFKITPDGLLTTIYSFIDTGTMGNGGPNSDGAYPGVLVQGDDGLLYGTTAMGGAYGYGTIFRMTTNGLLTTLYSFGTLTNAYGVPLDGAYAKSIVFGRDGNLYGTADGGGPFGVFYENGGYGTAFRLSIVRPQIRFTSPLWPFIRDNPQIVISGKAKGKSCIADVFYQLNGGDWIEANAINGWDEWTANLTLSPGMNVIRAYAVDSFGDTSKTNALRLKYFGKAKS